MKAWWASVAASGAMSVFQAGRERGVAGRRFASPTSKKRSGTCAAT